MPCGRVRTYTNGQAHLRCTVEQMNSLLSDISPKLSRSEVALDGPGPQGENRSILYRKSVHSW